MIRSPIPIEHRRPARCKLAVPAALLVLVAAPAARAADAADRLFNEGKVLIEQGYVSAGCDKLAKSQELRPRGGTLLNLATCREREGRLATAELLFEQALAVAQETHRADRVQVAQKHLAALRTQVSWLEVSLVPGADLPGLSVQRDGEDLPRDRWGSPQKVDGGAHLLLATAPGRVPFKARVHVGAAADKQTVEIPVLAPEPIISPPVALVAEPALPPAAPPPVAAIAPAVAAWRKPLGGVVLGLSGAGLVLGTVAGVSAITQSNASKLACPGGVCTKVDDLQQNQNARTSARVADVVFPVSLLAAGAGLYLILTSRSALVVAPAAGQRTAGAAVRGAF